MAKRATTPGGSSVPAAAPPFSHAAQTKSKCTWDPWIPLTNCGRPTNSGPSVASPGYRRFRSRDDTKEIVTPRAASRSRSQERRERTKYTDRRWGLMVFGGSLAVTLASSPLLGVSVQLPPEIFLGYLGTVRTARSSRWALTSPRNLSSGLFLILLDDLGILRSGSGAGWSPVPVPSPRTQC
jgi:hypothetical protein